MPFYTVFATKTTKYGPVGVAASWLFHPFEAVGIRIKLAPI
jgi:hypothetical protein